MYSIYPIRVSFPLTGLDSVEAWSMVCLRRMNAMDTIRLVLNIRPEEINPVVTAGSPMRVIWYADGQSDEFYGYVHSFRPGSDGYQKQTVVIGVSTAYPMYNESGRTYTEHCIHHVAEDIANDYRFQVETEPHPLIQAQILQADESDWSFLVRLASDWGYVLAMDGATLIFRPLRSILEENNIIAEEDRVLNQFPGKRSSIVSFKPNFSAAGRSPLAVNVGKGVSAVDASTISWNQETSGVFQQVSTERSVNSELEGQMVAVAKDAKARFPFTAEAVVLHPIGKKALDAFQVSHEGKSITWTIHTVKHVVDGARYTGNMILGSDGVDYLKGKPRDRIDIQYLIRRASMPPRPEPVIIDTRQFYAGVGANAVIDDQRWKARVVHSRRRST